MKPCNTNILVKVEPPTLKTGLIHIPEFTYSTAPKAALVIETGNKVNSEVKKGMRVLVPAYGGLPVQVKGKNLKIFTEAEIFGILTDNAEVNV
jgi:co-chaperonin GroES (HSP10)